MNIPRKTYRRIHLWLAVISASILLPATGQTAARFVTSAADSGPGTLRSAILAAAPGDTIHFDGSVFPAHTAMVIYLSSALPPLTQNGLVIDASSSYVVLDGYNAPPGTNGLVLEGSNITIRGLRIQEFSGKGIWVRAGANNNTLGGSRAIGAAPHGQGNEIVTSGENGIEIMGSGNGVFGSDIGIKDTVPAGNKANGIALWSGASNNTIGTSDPNYRNAIGSNQHNGIWVGSSGTNGNRILGNLVGIMRDGSDATNLLAGIAVQSGATANDIGGTAPGEGNTISRNANNGIYISDAGTRLNRILGNRIGTNSAGTAFLGQSYNGILIANGASDTSIGDGSAAGMNVIGGNSNDGIQISGSATTNNYIKGNHIGSDVSGSYAIPNGLHGVELTDRANANIVGGYAQIGQGNLISGNMNHGVVITDGAYGNTVQGNIIGPDHNGSTSLGNHESGGIDIANGAHDNTIGGYGQGEGNLISGNKTDGIALFVVEGAPLTTERNHIVGNRIGLKLASDEPLANGGPGILNTHGTKNTLIEANQIAFNEGYGIHNAVCTGNTVRRNSIYGNRRGAVLDEPTCVAQGTIAEVLFTGSEVVMGKALPNSTVEIFSDDDGQGKHYEGTTTADGNGDFTLAQVGGFAGNDIAVVVTDAAGNSSAYSAPYHLQWTIALYFNGDNNLEEYLLDTISNTIAAVSDKIAANHSPRANIVALVDGKSPQPDTFLIDLTHGQRDVQAGYLPNEQNLGDGQTLINFMAWVKARYPARHTLLAIVDHGGGWAPSDEDVPQGSLPGSRRHWLAGGSGLSWDDSSNFDYLNMGEIRQAFAVITNNGSDPLDVVFFDVCLMGMVEVAYELRTFADIYVSSQNIGWAPLGVQNRYAEIVRLLPANAAAAALATLLVNTYGASLPPERHPYTISAVDLAQIDAVRAAADNLAKVLSQVTTDSSSAETLAGAYRAAQKLDYDSDLRLEPDTDGFVDLLHFAKIVTEVYSDPAVVAAAQSVQQRVNAAVISESHLSGTPWMLTDRVWDLENANGISVFLPLGEDLELTIPVAATAQSADSAMTEPYLKLRDLYTAAQLSFVADSGWRPLIDRYYWAVAQPVPVSTTSGPVAGLQRPDVEPPSSEVKINDDRKVYKLGETLLLNWSAKDGLTGVAGAALMHRTTEEPWHEVATSSAAEGQFAFKIHEYACEQWLAVSSHDLVGNHESIGEGNNTASFQVNPCYQEYLPTIKK
jgi:hypothetical protein